jgi:hypothetical protein
VELPILHFFPVEMHRMWGKISQHFQNTMNTTGNNALGEKPLSGGARAMLVLGVGATMLLFYVFAVVSILLLAALIGGEFIIFLALACFGAARLIASNFGKHIVILKSWSFSTKLFLEFLANLHATSLRQYSTERA